MSVCVAVRFISRQLRVGNRAKASHEVTSSDDFLVSSLLREGLLRCNCSGGGACFSRTQAVGWVAWSPVSVFLFGMFLRESRPGGRSYRNSGQQSAISDQIRTGNELPYYKQEGEVGKPRQRENIGKVSTKVCQWMGMTPSICCQ